MRSRIPKTDYRLNYQPIILKYWKLNWLSALQKAEQAGGKSFREKYSNEALQITAELAHLCPKNYLCWRIKYLALKSKDSKTVLVNANTGEVVGGTAENATSAEENQLPE